MLDKFVTGNDGFGQSLLDALGINSKHVSRIVLDVEAGKVVTVTVTNSLTGEYADNVYKLLSKYQAQLDGEANESNNPE